MLRPAPGVRGGTLARFENLRSSQYKWLEAKCHAVNCTLAPWLASESRQPMNKSKFIFDETAVGVGMRYEFEELLYE